MLGIFLSVTHQPRVCATVYCLLPTATLCRFPVPGSSSHVFPSPTLDSKFLKLGRYFHRIGQSGTSFRVCDRSANLGVTMLHVCGGWLMRQMRKLSHNRNKNTIDQRKIFSCPYKDQGPSCTRNACLLEPTLAPSSCRLGLALCCISAAVCCCLFPVRMSRHHLQVGHRHTSTLVSSEQVQESSQVACFINECLSLTNHTLTTQ